MSDECPLVSVVLINFKDVQQLEKCLHHLVRTDYPNYEIIVVDCLTENLETWIKQHFPTVKVIHYDHDIGPSASHNVDKNFLNSQSKYLAFLDNDAYVTENWLIELVKVMEYDSRIGIAQAKILMARESGLLDNAGLAVDALGSWYTTRGLKDAFFQKVFEIFAASSACCLVLRKVFEEAGGFDPDYFIYDDDTDFSFRVRLLGYKVVFVPSAIAYHDAEPARTLNPRKLFHSVKNRVCTMLKNYELKNLWWRATVYSCLTLLVGVGFTFLKRFYEAKETFRGIFYPLLNFKKIWEKRVIIQSCRRVTDSELFKLSFIRSDIYATISDFKSKIGFFL